MKRKLMMILSCVLAVGLMFGLSACSVDIHTGKEDETIHLDFGELDFEELGLGDLNLSDVIMMLESIDWDEVSEGLKEKVEEVFPIEEYLSEDSDLLQNLYDEAEKHGMDLENLGESLESGMENLGTWLDDEWNSLENSIEEEKETVSEEYEEVLEALQEILEEKGMGDYYSLILAQIRSNPEWIQSFMKSSDGKGILSMLIEEFNAVSEEDAEIQEETLPFGR